MKARDTVCFHVKYAWHSIQRMYNERAQKHGSSAAIGFVLLNIDPETGTPSTSIGPSIGLDPHGLSRMLKNLEEEGLIFREADKKDKRKVIIKLTPKGLAGRDVAREEVKNFNYRLRAQIPERKLEVFFEVMEKIHNILSEENAEVQ